jgi:4a-hydroxytetrahydrobiopterin dehydratase
MAAPQDDTVTAPAFAALDGLDDWRYLLGRIEATFVAPSAADAAAFAATAVAASHGRPPDLDLRGTTVHVALPGGAGPLVASDLATARAISGTAARHRLPTRPVAALRAEIAIDALDIDAVLPFWRAALAYDDGEPWEGRVIDLVDPLRVGPPVWFQQMDAIRPERNHIHIDVTVAHDVAEERVTAVLEAGGRLVSDDRARAFWVLADPEGNEACICTWQDRG